jgi:plastocyanin
VTKQTTIQFALVTISLVFLFSIVFQGDADAVSKTINAGGDGSNWDKFLPQNTSINAGESVKWTNHMPAAEPHTVTFMNDDEMFPPLFAVLTFKIILNLSL